MTDQAPPFFAKAPVIERVLGAQFIPIPPLTNAHLGAFWVSLGADWPTVLDMPPLPPQFENFPSAQPGQIPAMLMISAGAVGARILIKNRSADRIIQIQNGSIHYNWIGEGEQYPRYDTIHNEFFEIYERFCEFARSVGEVAANQWEITYLNHIPKGTVWHTPQDWDKAFAKPISLPFRLYNATLEDFAGQWKYLLDNNRGRMYAELQHAAKLIDNKPSEILALRLTCRGPVIAGNPELSLESGLTVGHEAIVHGFPKIASQSSRNFWEEK